MLIRTISACVSRLGTWVLIIPGLLVEEARRRGLGDTAIGNDGFFSGNPNNHREEGFTLAKRIQVPFEGQMVPADQLDFESDKEPWTVYKLEDGTVLRIKTILGSVARIVGRYKPDGEPIYALGITGVPMLEVPPELRRQAAKPTTQKE